MKSGIENRRSDLDPVCDPSVRGSMCGKGAKSVIFAFAI